MYSRKILLTKSQIDTVNWENFRRPATGLYSLADADDTILPDTLQLLLQKEKLPQEPRYDKIGNLYRSGFYKALEQRMWAAVPTVETLIRHAVLIDNSFLRLFPPWQAAIGRMKQENWTVLR